MHNAWSWGIPLGANLNKRPANATIVVHSLSEALGLFTLLVYLIKRPGVCKAAIPDLINHLRSLHIILAVRPMGYGYRRPPLNTLLMLICQLPLASVPELPPEPALSAQRRSTDLSASGVS